jgi:hypothetical protein
MFLTTVAMAAALLAQQPAEGAKAEIPVLKAGLGSCSADFTVKDASGKAAYSATIRVRIRYGMMGVKRMDLEVSTNSDGKARIEGLPSKARPLTYDIEKSGETATVEQDLATSCQMSTEVSLK